MKLFCSRYCLFAVIYNNEQLRNAANAFSYAKLIPASILAALLMRENEFRRNFVEKADGKKLTNIGVSIIDEETD